MSQSLFYWNPFCNNNHGFHDVLGDIVAILILLESFLQYKATKLIENCWDESQSLFYWNPFCNTEEGVPLAVKNVSQSLFYWNPFCNPKGGLSYFMNLNVAILILLESFLQCTKANHR